MWLWSPVVARWACSVSLATINTSRAVGNGACRQRWRRMGAGTATTGCFLSSSGMQKSASTIISTHLGSVQRRSRACLTQSTFSMDNRLSQRTLMCLCFIAQLRTIALVHSSIWLTTWIRSRKINLSSQILKHWQSRKQRKYTYLAVFNCSIRVNSLEWMLSLRSKSPRLKQVSIMNTGVIVFYWLLKFSGRTSGLRSLIWSTLT